MTTKQISFLILLLFSLFLSQCKFFGPEWKSGPSEEMFADDIKYIRAESDIEKQFEDAKMDPRQIAKEKLIPQIQEFKEGIQEKSASNLVYLASPNLIDSYANGYYSSTIAAAEAWEKSFETGKAWCEFDLFFKTKVVAYEIIPSGVTRDNISYDVYLRQAGQTGKLTREDAYEKKNFLLHFESFRSSKGELGRFSINGFAGHCPLTEDQFHPEFGKAK
ncbi:hypothetical protein [Leptospira kirschneri]|uniref:Uncharacterized protein n=1 Tax=Leptospira kirschneri str. 200802841 TaxID=1193047 RepID=A0A828Y401_9LEPT|nr:hypothetical protein [Leptospira kirschneri]EKO49800.1 hypothetical protein LEP1GSC131_1012 [Leptospira kirschneri str. 200802841]